MAHDRRITWFSGQLVDEGDLSRDDDAVDYADGRVLRAAGLPAPHIASGLDVSITGSDLTVSVGAGDAVPLHTDPNAPSSSYPFPFRAAAGDVDLTDSVPSGSARYVAVCAKWSPTQASPTTDDENATVYKYLDAGSELIAVEGEEGGSPPTVPVDHVLVCDVYLPPALSAILRMHLSFARVRAAWQKTAGGVAQQLSDLAATQLDNCRGYVKEPQAVVANAMKIVVRPGRINLSDRSVDVAGGTVTIVASPTPGKHRIALVYIDADGDPQVAYGDETVYTAAPPSLEGRYPVCTIEVLDTTTTLDPDDLVDVRPFARMAQDVPNRFKFTAGGGETTVTITDDWTFVPGSHGLQVYKNGLLLAESAYTENAAGDGIAGLAALSGGNVVELVAPRMAGTNPVVAHAGTHAADGADPIDYATLGGLVVPGLEISSETTGQIVTISPFSAIIGGRMRSSSSVETVDFGAEDYGANHWVYLYAYWDDGIAFEVSTTEPDQGRRFKNGDVSRTFLAPIRTLSGGSHYAKRFVLRDREVFYPVDYTKVTVATSDVESFCLASITGDTANHSVDCSYLVPPWIKFMRLGVKFDDAATAGKITTLVGNGGISPTAVITGPGQVVFQEITAYCGSAQAVQVTNDANGSTTRLWAAGYRF